MLPNFAQRRPPIPQYFLPLIISLLLWELDINATLSNKGKLQYISLFCLYIYLISKYNKSAIIIGKYNHTLPPLIIFITFGISGIIIGKLYFGSVNGPLPLIIPWIFIFFIDNQYARVESIRSGLLYISWLCLAGNVLTLLARNLSFLHVSLFQFSHESSYLIPISLGSAFILKNPLLIILNSTTSILMWISYPSGTYVLTFIVSIIYFFFHIIRKNRKILTASLILFYSIQITLLYFSIFNFQTLSENSNLFYNLVGRQDNTLYRKYLVDQLFSIFRDHPIFGSGFTGEILVTTRFSLIPAHNDYLTLLAASGIFGLIIYLMIQASIIFQTITNISKLAEIEKKVVFMILCSVSVYQISMCFNPLSMKVFNSMIYISLLFMLKSITSNYVDLKFNDKKF